MYKVIFLKFNSRPLSHAWVVVSLGFFDDIYIPAENLMKTSRFDEAEQTWVWEYETEDGKHDLFMDSGMQ